jgi:hypothetical protein
MALPVGPVAAAWRFGRAGCGCLRRRVVCGTSRGPWAVCAAWCPGKSQSLAGIVPLGRFGRPAWGVILQQAGEGFGNWCGWLAEPDKDLVAVGEDVVDGESNQVPDRLGIEEGEDWGVGLTCVLTHAGRWAMSTLDA